MTAKRDDVVMQAELDELRQEHVEALRRAADVLEDVYDAEHIIETAPRKRDRSQRQVDSGR
jgi:hypothetical protein